MRFLIEHIVNDSQPVTLLARQIDSGEFTLSEHPTLGGIPIRRQLSQPRTVNKDGQPDLSIFAFALEAATDLPKVAVGQILDLGSAQT